LSVVTPGHTNPPPCPSPTARDRVWKFDDADVAVRHRLALVLKPDLKLDQSLQRPVVPGRDREIEIDHPLAFTGAGLEGIGRPMALPQATAEVGES